MVSAVMLMFDVILTIVGISSGLFCSTRCAHKRNDRKSVVVQLLHALVLGIIGVCGVLWVFLSPPPFSQRVTNVQVAHAVNEPGASLYLGNGCFWHTQYDTAVVEQGTSGAFAPGRTDAAVTSLVGYAGGNWMSPGGTACYHGVPATDYGKLGHSEAVSVVIDAANSSAQVSELMHMYFEHGFRTVSCTQSQLGCVDGARRQRLDPQDAGPMYRNVIGLPGGLANTSWMVLIEAANHYRMPLVAGRGGPAHDHEGEYIVYVYDSATHPFFRAEGAHQFHVNSVIGRPVPASYTRTLKAVQEGLGRMSGHGCIDPPTTVLGYVWPALMPAPLGVAIGLVSAVVEGRRRDGPKAGEAEMVSGGRVVPDEVGGV